MKKAQVIKTLIENGWAMPEAIKSYKYLSANDSIEVDSSELFNFIYQKRFDADMAELANYILLKELH